MKNKMKWLYLNGYLKKKRHVIKIKLKKVFNPKTLKQLAREKLKLVDEELANHMINGYYSSERN